MGRISIVANLTHWSANWLSYPLRPSLISPRSRRPTPYPVEPNGVSYVLPKTEKAVLPAASIDDSHKGTLAPSLFHKSYGTLHILDTGFHHVSAPYLLRSAPIPSAKSADFNHCSSVTYISETTGIINCRPYLLRLQLLSPAPVFDDCTTRPLPHPDLNQEPRISRSLPSTWLALTRSYIRRSASARRKQGARIGKTWDYDRGRKP